MTDLTAEILVKSYHLARGKPSRTASQIQDHELQPPVLIRAVFATERTAAEPF